MGYWPVVENVIRNSDIVLLVMDVRMPQLSRNAEIERKIIKYGKELVLVFTKTDLASDAFVAEQRTLHPEAFFVSGTQNEGIGKLRRALQIMAHQCKLNRACVGVVGYPNIGKSALINALARRARALVADKPGTTRGVQWINIGKSLRILDSPGVIPSIDRSSTLALIGSKSPDSFKNPESVALDIIRQFISSNRGALEERYKLTIAPLTNPTDILRMIGNKRGFLKKGGEVDETKTAITVLRDWQKGKLKI